MEINILSWAIRPPEMAPGELAGLCSDSANSSGDSHSPPPELDSDSELQPLPPPKKVSIGTPVQKAFSALTDLGLYRPHVLCFQDVAPNNISEEIKEVAAESWQFHTDFPFMIGFDPKRFEKISAKKLKDHLSLDLKEIQTGKILRVASATFPSNDPQDAVLDLDRTLESGEEAPELCLAGINVNHQVQDGQIKDLKDWGYHVIAENCGGGYRDVQAVVAKSGHHREVKVLGQAMGMLIPYDNPLLNPSRYSPLLATVDCEKTGFVRDTYSALSTFNCMIQ